MHAVLALPVLSSLLWGHLAGAAGHARVAQITAPPSVANLVPRQNDQCPPTHTLCPDGFGCCEEGAPCTTLDDGDLGCAAPCVGEVEMCPDGQCCGSGRSCSPSAGDYLCVTDSGPPSLTIPSFTDVAPTMTEGSSSSAGGGGADTPSDSGPLIPTPTETAGSSSMAPPDQSSSGPATGESSSAAPEAPNPSDSSSAQGGNQPSSTGGSPPVFTGSAARVDIPFMTWLSVLAGAFF